MQGGSLRHCKLYFFAEQKNNIKWRRRRKKFGYSAKHAAFYTTESLNEPFLGVRLRVRLSSVSGKVVRGRRKTESRIPLFFFFFPQTSKPARSGFETSKSTQAISLMVFPFICQVFPPAPGMSRGCLSRFVPPFFYFVCERGVFTFQIFSFSTPFHSN